MLPIRKLLVTTDFSDPARKGVLAADELALHFGAELLVVHVIPPSHYVPPAGTGGFNPAKLTEEIQAMAKESLDQILQRDISEKVSARSLMLLGPPADEIARTASEEKVDAIVISTHGLTGWRRFVFGSVAEKVVRLSPCPVITIPAGEEEQEG
jgi:nucleotide-binding universal stress UspA family protein